MTLNIAIKVIISCLICLNMWINIVVLALKSGPQIATKTGNPAGLLFRRIRYSVGKSGVLGITEYRQGRPLLPQGGFKGSTFEKSEICYELPRKSIYIFKPLPHQGLRFVCYVECQMYSMYVAESDVRDEDSDDSSLLLFSDDDSSDGNYKKLYKTYIFVSWTFPQML